MNMSGWFTSTINIASQTGTLDSYGKPTFGAAREVKARVEGQRRMVRGPNREDSLSTHRIFTDQVVLITDRIWLPGLSPLTVALSKVPIAVLATPSKSAGQTLYQVDL